MAVFNVSVSPVRPVDNVLERRLFVSPKAGTGPEYVVVVDPDINGIEGELSDDQVPASCYLIDVNKTGPSAASPSFPLVPELPPTPFESVPATPAILGVTWGTNPSVRTPAPACSRKASQAPIVFDRRACAKC